MKKLFILFLSAILMVACVLSVSATQDNTGAELGPAPDTPNVGEINYLTQDNFPNTEGFTDYPILKNDNVKWYYYKTDSDKSAGILTEFTYDYEIVDDLAHGAMLGDCRSAFQIFKWSYDYESMHPWYYNGIKLEMSDMGVVEINFNGSAINLICSYLANPVTGVMQGAKVQVDDGEWQTVGYEEFTAVDNTVEGRSVMKRWFKVDNLEYGPHTVRIMNDCLPGNRLPFDAYEVREAEAPVTTEPPVTSGTIADTSDSISSTNEPTKDTSTSVTSGGVTTTIPDASSDIAGDDDTSNGPTVGIIIGIIAAAVVVAVVVVIIVKKRKS